MCLNLINTACGYRLLVMDILLYPEYFPAGIDVLADKRNKQYLKSNRIWNNKKNTKDSQIIKIHIISPFGLSPVSVIIALRKNLVKYFDYQSKFCHKITAVVICN